MNSFSLREWESISIGDAEGGIPRHLASQLLRAAGKAQKRLRSPNAPQILSERGQALRAGQVVGVLRAPGVTLEILPKIGARDDPETRTILVRMLAYILNLKIAADKLVELGHQKFDVLEIVIQLFCKKLFTAIHRGLPRRYIKSEEDLPTLRGRLNITRQYTILAVSSRVACNFDILSVDSPMGRILRAAVRQLRNIARSDDNQRRLTEIELALSDIASVDPRALPWASVVLDRTNADWHELLDLAQLLLGQRFQTVSSGNDLGFSLLFEMNVLFEAFVGKAMQRAIRRTELHITLQCPVNYAVSVGEDLLFKTKPDIVLHRGQQPISIIDTKWKILVDASTCPKLGVSQSDIYQVMAYGQIYGVSHLMLLYPHHQALAQVGIQQQFNVRVTSQLRVTISTLDLSDFDSVFAQVGALCEAYRTPGS
jgi:5-methylcytosine-specific restriction enzyme subunit McrC